MRNPTYVLFVLILQIKTITAFGQDDMQKNKEIGISFFSLEDNNVTLNPGLKPKFVYGVYFNQYFSNLSWISHMEYGNNVINDVCNSCIDSFAGKGKMTEFAVSTGFRNTFFRQKAFFVKPFLESDFYYSYIRYKGDFSGGFWNTGIKIDNFYNTTGIQVGLGLSFYPISRISITISSSARIGIEKKNGHYQEINEIIDNYKLTLLHIRLGYLF
jgi:hypothetical protein